MYVSELAVQFQCASCDTGITAPEEAWTLVCPDCRTFQAAQRSRMKHFEWRGGEAGRRKAEAEIPIRLAERDKLFRLRRRRWPLMLIGGLSGLRFGRSKALYAQMKAVEHRLKQCQETLNS